ncbi:UDP-N-acetylmuramate--L-alanine ligase [Patescibacteria group bacterium]|jgi:UDP-N-acetylmuramate--alanine ligase|nr:UDP-N-acetylmuramate--L-alanine ligase [Patescibacteria group bacterium]
MTVHLIGIGGIGLSALAQLYVARGDTVTGSDRDPNPAVHELLAQKGIEVVVGHDAANVPEGAELVVYSDAIVEGTAGFVERAAAEERGIPTTSYFGALGEVSEHYRTIAVAGTHGKTTTTGLLGKALVDLGADPTVVVGSLVADLGGNFRLGASDLLVVEACEYRDHLLALAPEVLIITNLEWDHSDWFPDLAALAQTFRRAITALPEAGALITDPHHPNIAPLLGDCACPVLDYTQVAIGELALLGEFNRMNARAAKAAARLVAPAADDEDLDRSLATFAGSWRRFEYKGVTAGGAPVFDDYAHHPTAIRETLLAARERFPDQALVVLFQPHLYSRTRDLFDGFAHALSIADRVLLLPIYPARERAEDFGGVSSEALAAAVADINGSAEALARTADAPPALAPLSPEYLLITMGAGETDRVASALTTR